VNAMLKVLVLFVTTFGLLGISIPSAFAGEPADYGVEPVFRDAIQRSANPINVLDISEYAIGAIIQVPRVIQPLQPASQINFPINSYDEVFDELPTLRIPKVVDGLQPVVDLGYF